MNVNNFRKTTITGLQFGSAQRVHLKNGLVFCKDTPHQNSDGSWFYSYSVVDANNNLVECGSANTLTELKSAAKNIH